jgi:hypothetical protein
VWPEEAGAATPRSSKAAADADEAIAPQDRDAFGRLRRGRRNPPAGGTRKRIFGGRGKPPRQDSKGFGPEGDAEAGGSGGNRPEADAGQGPGRVFGSGLGPNLRRVASRLAGSRFRGGGGRSKLASVPSQGREGGSLRSRTAVREGGSPSSQARRNGRVRPPVEPPGGAQGSRPKSLPTGSAGAFALRARPTGAERGFASLRNPPTQRVIARPRRRDREPGTSGAGGDAGPHVVFGSKQGFEAGFGGMTCPLLLPSPPP